MTGAIVAPRARGVLGSAMLGVLIVGFVLWILADTGLFNNSDAYGSGVSIPGSAVIRFPRGEVDGTFQVGYYSTNTNGIILPEAQLAVQPVTGQARPIVVRDLGGSDESRTDTSSVLSERIWRIQVPQAGDYRVLITGTNRGYGGAGEIAFGHTSASNLASLALGIGLAAEIALGLIWFALGRVTRRIAPTGVGAAEKFQALAYMPRVIGMMRANRGATPQVTAPVSKLDQLEQLGQLHERGALTDEEFAAEKARVLGR
jgi:hypothetical protein